MKEVTNSDAIEQIVKYQQHRIEALQNKIEALQRRLKEKTEQAMRIITQLRKEEKNK